MTSTIKVDNIQDQDGNNIINESGTTVTIGKAGNNIRTGGDNIQAADGGNRQGAGRGIQNPQSSFLPPELSWACLGRLLGLLCAS